MPRVLLLDEPFGALDAQIRKDLRRWLKDVHRLTGQTTIFVTHDQGEALEIADRVAILNRGRVEQIGTPDEVYDAPASPFVMAFVGDSVRLPVQVTAGAVSMGGRRLSLSSGEAQDGEADLFVQPTDLVLADPASGDLPGRVRTVRRIGGGYRAEIVLDIDDIHLDIDVPQARPAIATVWP